MSAPEFSRIVKLDEVRGSLTRDVSASEIERAALARRFGLVAITHLEATVTIAPEGDTLRATGAVTGRAIASCVVSGADVPQEVASDIDLLLVDGMRPTGEEEVELDEGDLDVLEFEGGRIDLGEIAASVFALALDPYPRASADELAEARKMLLSEEEAEAISQADKAASSPFSALKKS